MGTIHAFVKASRGSSVVCDVWNVSPPLVDVAGLDFCEFRASWVQTLWNVPFLVYVKRRRNVVSLESEDFWRRMLWNEVEH